MNNKAKSLSERLESFNNEVISFVKGCSEEDWRKMCPEEEWPVGVTARHIGAGHYQALSMVSTILKGEKLPVLTMEEIVEMANRHAREHADCTKPEVLDILEKDGRTMVQFVAGLEDSDLEKTGYLHAMGMEITVGKFIEAVVRQSGRLHFESMKAAVKG